MFPLPLGKIIGNLVSLQLAPDMTAAILSAIFGPLLRNAETPQAGLEPTGSKPTRRPSSKRSRRATGRRKYKRRAGRRQSASSDGPRERARAAISAHPGATVSTIAKLARVAFGTVVNARKDLAAEARKVARETTSSTISKPTERRQRAQQFLREQLARGAKQASVVEEAAAKAHIDEQALGQARGDLGIVASRANAGGVQAVQWALPG